MKKIIMILLLSLLLSITKAYADSAGTTTSSVWIACLNTSMQLTLDKTTYTTTEIANMSVYIHNNNSFLMNSTLLIELRSPTSVVKIMVSDTIQIGNYSWYNFSYYNDFAGVPTGIYTMRARLLDLSGNPQRDCYNNEIFYDISGVQVAQTEVIGGGGVGGGLIPTPLIYGATCPFYIKTDDPMNVKFSVKNPLNSLYQTSITTELWKETIIRKDVKKIITSKPGSTITWEENLGNATCDTPYGLHVVKIVWRQISGEIIRTDELGCFYVPQCEKLIILNLTSNKPIFYVNETGEISAIVKNMGNVPVGNAIFNLTVENFITGTKHFKQFLIDYLEPNQYFTFKLIMNLTEIGPHIMRGTVEKENKIIDKNEKSFIVTLRPTFYDLLILLIVIIIFAILIALKIWSAYKEKKRKESLRRMRMLRYLRKKK